MSKTTFLDNSDPILYRYLREISKYKFLNPEETNNLIKLAQEGDLKAREKLINSNLRFVVSVAKQYMYRGIPVLDLISEGTIGLIHSIDKFDFSKNVTFLTYAYWWIKQKIYISIYGESKSIRLPLTQYNINRAVAKASNDFFKEHGRNPSSIELSELTDIPVEHIDYIAQFNSNLLSFEDYVGDSKLQICEVIPDGELGLDEQLNRSYQKDELLKIMSNLSLRDHDLLCMLYGIGMPPVDVDTICNIFNIGKERIRQMKIGALSKLKRCYSNTLKKLL